jgi:hypothetical protein
MQNSLSHAWGKPAQPLGRLNNPPKKTEQQTVNSSSTTSEGAGMPKVHQRKEEKKELISA